METVEGGATEDHVVFAFEGNHLKGYRLFVMTQKNPFNRIDFYFILCIIMHL
jgi:hypothetical protein